MAPKVYALSRCYLDCLECLRMFSIFMPKLCSGGLNAINEIGIVLKWKKARVTLKMRSSVLNVFV